MLYTIIVVLLVLWLLGGGIPSIALYSVGSLIHIVLVIALILLIVQLVTGRRTL